METYTFTFTKEEKDAIIKGLAELPAKISFDVITKLLQKKPDEEKEVKN